MMRGRGPQGWSSHMEKFIKSPRIIFVGLDMTALETAGKADVRNSILMGIILLATGLAGITLLFLIQSYRTAKTSLNRIKAFSDHLVENVPIGLLTVDPRERVSSYNQVAKDILRLSENQTLMEPAVDVLPTGLWQEMIASENENGAVDQEIDVTFDDGTVIPLEIRAGGLQGENGDDLGSVLLFKDLSEVRSLRKEVARSQRLATVGRLAAGVAHEIRNPLSSIKGFATYFKERYQDVAEDLHIADIMIKEVDRLNRVVGQLLAFAKPVRVTPGKVSINQFITDSLKLVERQSAEKGISVNSELLPTDQPIILDTDKIRQVLLNLYLNAIESMANGGHLTVRLAEAQRNGGITIQVVDTGIGIQGEDLSHIFDPYFTTKSSGTGIGLAVAHNIIKAHGGRVHVESEPGSGTQFTVFLPQRKGE